MCLCVSFSISFSCALCISDCLCIIVYYVHTGVAVHYSDAADLPHWLSWCGVPHWRLRHGYCPERSGQFVPNSTPLCVCQVEYCVWTQNRKKSETKVHSRSIDRRKLFGARIAINYTPLSMAYYAYDSTANFLSLRSTVLIGIPNEWRCKEELHCFGNLVIWKLSEGQLNANELWVTSWET